MIELTAAQIVTVLFTSGGFGACVVGGYVEGRDRPLTMTETLLAGLSGGAAATLVGAGLVVFIGAIS